MSVLALLDFLLLLFADEEVQTRDLAGLDRLRQIGLKAWMQTFHSFFLPVFDHLEVVLINDLSVQGAIFVILV